MDKQQVSKDSHSGSERGSGSHSSSGTSRSGSRKSGSSKSSSRSSSSSNSSSGSEKFHSCADEKQQQQEVNNGNHEEKKIPKIEPPTEKSVLKKQDTSKSKEKEEKHQKAHKSKVEKVEESETPKGAKEDPVKRAETKNKDAKGGVIDVIKEGISDEEDTMVIEQKNAVAPQEKQVRLDNKKQDHKGIDKGHNKDKDRKEDKKRPHRDRQEDKSKQHKHKEEEKRLPKDKEEEKHRDKSHNRRRSKDNSNKDAVKIRIPTPEKRTKSREYSSFAESSRDSYASSSSCESLREPPSDSNSNRDSRSPKKKSKRYSKRRGSSEEEKIGQDGKRSSGRGSRAKKKKNSKEDKKPNKEKVKVAVIKTTFNENYKICLEKWIKYSMLPVDDFDVPPEEYDDLFEIGNYLTVTGQYWLKVTVKIPKRINAKKAELYISTLKGGEEVTQIKYHPKLMDYISENFKGTSRNLPLGKLPIDFARNQDDRVTIRHLHTHDSNLVMDIKNYTSKIEVDKLKHMPLEKGLADIIHDVKSIPAWRLLDEKLTQLYAPLKFEIKK